MTALPATTGKKLGLVIDLDTCVGCQACATSCKEWNTGGYSAPLTDQDPVRVQGRVEAQPGADTRVRPRRRFWIPDRCDSRRITTPTGKRHPRTFPRRPCR